MINVKSVLFIVLISNLVSCSVAYSYSGLTPNEREMLFRIEDLKLFGLKSTKTSKDARIMKMNILSDFTAIGGGIHYEYDFDQDEESGGDPVAIFNYISKRNVMSSVFQRFLFDAVQNLEADEDISYKELPKFYNPDNNCKSYLTLYKNVPVGNVVKYTNGNISYFLSFSGIYFADEKVWNKFFKKKLDRIIKL